LLVSILLGAAPLKTPKEIQARQDYFKRLQEGDSLLAGRKLDQARLAYREAVELLPAHWKAYFRLGASWNIVGHLDQANAFYAKGLQINPTHALALTRYGGNLNFQGKFEQAENTLQKAIRSWPFIKIAYDALAQVYIKTNEPARAVTSLQWAIDIDPNYGPGHANLAVAYTLLNQRKKAHAHLKRAMALGVKGPVIDQLAGLYNKDASGGKAQ